MQLQAPQAALLWVQVLAQGAVLVPEQPILMLLLWGVQMARSQARLQVAFLPLQLRDVAGLRAQPGLAPGVLLNPGRGIAVEVQPLLEALNIGGARALTLYGRPGTNYVIESAASPAGPWQAQYSVTLTNLLQSLDASAGTNAPAIFYRVRQ